MKKLISPILILLISSIFLTSCTEIPESGNDNGQEEPPLPIDETDGPIDVTIPVSNSAIPKQIVYNNQIIVKFHESASPTLVQQFIDQYEILYPISYCPCNPELLLIDFSHIVPALSPEERRKSVVDDLPQEGGGEKIGRAFLNFDIYLENINGEFGSNVSFNPSSPSGDPEVTVAIIDGGLLWDDLIFEDKLWTDPGTVNCDSDGHGYDFTPLFSDETVSLNRHGSFVGGIIAKDFSTDLQLNLMDLRIFDLKGRSSFFYAICATHYAITNNADVIHMSWGYYSETVDTLFLEALQQAELHLIPVVTSAGNDTLDTDHVKHFPSEFTKPLYELHNVISVSAIDSTGMNLAYYANYGEESVDLLAPGTLVLTFQDQNYEVNGTSFAAPQVTQVIAELFAQVLDLGVIDCVYDHSDSLTLGQEYLILNKTKVAEGCP